MADDFRNRTRGFLGLNSLKGQPAPTGRSAYARFTAPAADTSKGQLLAGALLYTFLTVFCIALVLGSVGIFGRVLFAVLGVLGFMFTMQRVVMVMNRRDESPTDPVEPDDDDAPRRPDASKRTGGTGQGSRSRGARRSGDPRRSR